MHTLTLCVSLCSLQAIFLQLILTPGVQPSYVRLKDAASIANDAEHIGANSASARATPLKGSSFTNKEVPKDKIKKDNQNIDVDGHIETPGSKGFHQKEEPKIQVMNIHLHGINPDSFGGLDPDVTAGFDKPPPGHGSAKPPPTGSAYAYPAPGHTTPYPPPSGHATPHPAPSSGYATPYPAPGHGYATPYPAPGHGYATPYPAPHRPHFYTPPTYTHPPYVPMALPPANLPKQNIFIRTWNKWRKAVLNWYWDMKYELLKWIKRL